MAKREVAKVVDEDFSSVFEIITRRRNRALMAVNVELLMTYWEIGAFLSPRIHAGSWDAAVVGRLADYLKRQDPTLRGYGKSNLYSMALVYETFSSDAFLAMVEKYHGKLRQQDFFQPLAGKSLIPTGKTEAANIFQPVVGKCLPPILAVLSFTNLTLIANHCSDAQEMLFYIVYACRERCGADKNDEWYFESER